MSKFTIIIIVILLISTSIAWWFWLYKNHKRVQDVNNRVSIFNDNEKFFDYIEEYINKNKNVWFSQKELQIKLKEKFWNNLDSISIVHLDKSKTNPLSIDLKTKQQFNYPYSVKYTYCFYCFEFFEPKLVKNLLTWINQPQSYKINNSWIVNYEK